MTKLSVSLSGHQTSISLEPEFINALREIANNTHKSVASIIKEIDKLHDRKNLSAAIRVWILNQYKNNQ